jgi:hypothetical protein
MAARLGQPRPELLDREAMLATLPPRFARRFAANLAGLRVVARLLRLGAPLSRAVRIGALTARTTFAQRGNRSPAAISTTPARSAQLNQLGAARRSGAVARPAVRPGARAKAKVGRTRH